MSTYRVWRRISPRDFPQYQDSHHIQQITAFFITIRYTLFFHYCLLPLASCLLPAPCSLLPTIQKSVPHEH
ncbi:hypothetical protein [Moorena producens]|uniref:hypothetical protein n=1 Tax=Moorena producens TaxID=1155739 RepID=UPI003C70B5E8